MLALSLFGFDIPLWVLIVAAVAVWWFRDDIKSLIRSLFDKFNQNKGNDEESKKIEELVRMSLQQHGVTVGDLNNLDGDRLISLLGAFTAFATALSKMTPGKVDDVVVYILDKVVAFLSSNKDVANTIANILNRIFANRTS